MNETQQNTDIIGLAEKKRYMLLLRKLNSDKGLSKKEIAELSKYEKQKNNAQATDKTEAKKRKPGGGRKSKYSPAIDEAAKALGKQGLTDVQIAAFFGVDKATLNNWKKQFPLFFDSLKTGKQMADAKVEAALFQRAVGYSVPDVHISSYEGVVTLTPIIKHYPPDTTAQIFWLKNRKPKVWRDKQDINHQFPEGCGVLAVPALMDKKLWSQFAKKQQNQK